MFFNPRELDAFWKKLEPVWNKEPLLIKQPFSTPFVDESRFLSYLQRWADGVRAGKQSFDVRVIDNDALPRTTDTSLDAFERRIAPNWRKDWYLYIPDGMQGYDGDLWDRAIELIMPAMKAHGGLPAGGMTIEMFYGKYQATPSGIHLDAADSFSFITRGPKRLLFWPPDRFVAKFKSPAKDPSHQQALTGRYTDHLHDAIVIDGEAGDVIYWPKDYWHIGASADWWAGMIALGTWWSATPSKLARGMLGGIIDLQGDASVYKIAINELESAAGELPPALGDMVGQVRTQVERRMGAAAKVGWAKFVTSYGFSTAPAPRERPSLGDSARLRVKHPISRVDLGRMLAVIAGGHETVTSCLNIQPAVARLKVGSEHAMSDLMRHLPDGDTDAAASLKGVLSDLVAFRAIDVM
jgi:50S ribosomal protein L16 3-hydroxylase